MLRVVLGAFRDMPWVESIFVRCSIGIVTTKNPNEERHFADANCVWTVDLHNSEAKAS